MKLKDLIDKFMHPFLLRIKIDGKFVLETLSTSSVMPFYANRDIDCLFCKYEIRYDMTYPYIEVWLKGDSNEPKTET